MTLNELRQRIFTTIQYALQKQSQQYKETDDDILTVGMMDYVLVNLFQNKISIEFEPNLRFLSRERHYAYDEIFEELENFNQDDITSIADELRADMERYFLNNPDDLRFDYYVNFCLEYQTRHNLKNTYDSIIQQKFINTHYQSALQQSINTHIELILNQQNKLKDEQKIGMFAQYVCDLDLMQYDELQLIDVIENIIAHSNDIRTKKFKDKFIDAVRFELNQWRDDIFMPRYYDIKEKTFFSKDYYLKEHLQFDEQDRKMIQLFVKQAYWRIKYKDMYPQFALRDLEWAFQDFDDELAKQYLEKGTGNIADELLTKNTDWIKASANDVLAEIRIEIKQEVAESYRQALAFIIQLLTVGFPKSYKISYQLKDKNAKGEKHFLNIKGLAKSSTHRFFAHALKYPQIYTDLQHYAMTAMCQFEWYNDVEAGEKSLMPSSYVVFGLALQDQQYFSLLTRYLQHIDDEHQSAHYEFINHFVEHWGIKDEHLSLSLLEQLTLSGQFHKPFKSIVQLGKNNPKIQTQLLDYIAQKQQYEQESLRFLWLGKK